MRSLTLVLTLALALPVHAAIEAPFPAPKVVARATIKKICKYRTDIITAAQLSSLSAQPFFACLIAEYTFLKNTTDDFVDVAAALGIYDDPSLGFAQIKLSTARPLAKQLYDEPVTDQKIISDLLTPKIAALYMAQLIENTIIDYSDFGFDISKSPGLICSAYLVGRSRSRASQHKKNGTQPIFNYYGRFAHQARKIAARIESGELCK
ncbi:MAG: DUF1402 family protein [Bdellovibrionota bacterium]